MRAAIRTLIAGALAIATLGAGTTMVVAAQPEIIRGSTRDTFFDEFILDLCGIETMTTVTEHWTLWRYADGSERFQVSRTFESADPRLPIEHGSGMSTFAPDGTQTVHGSPLRLRYPGGGVYLLDAGLVIFSDPLIVRGPHPSLDMDLADAYCPA